MKELLFREDSEFSEGYVYSEYRSDKPLDDNHNINAPEEIALLVGKTITKAEYLISDFRSVTDPSFEEEETGEETDFVMLTLSDEVGQEYKIYISRDPEMNSSGYIRGLELFNVKQ